ncbi:hypothetical protein BAY61_02325 [Prauserella marina]|uniref:O-antigen ligase n=1 Tax=Prauserella marina TaxID=530584 RepID=A0A222VJE2_9PSEU|nr:O-antigen ligase domain-containing protein [Prauserella marina]ASR34017.1 hypothetical protein BAY61_02325 [Prauserella marina]PWV82641.1 O-antigen ligase [Prauserella marina]SDC73671.1 O-antigen ligase [Prauserella marina]
MRQDERLRPVLDTEPAKPPALVGAVWALLVVNTLGSQGAQTLISIPQSVYQLITMGSLVIAFAIALVLNPRFTVRPNAFLLILTALLVTSLVSTAPLEVGYGGLFRCARFAMFIATLWLLSRWWDGTLTLVRRHIRVLGAVLVPVVLGLVVAPGLAMPDVYEGRLTGALWPFTPPQVGQYSAIVAGLTIVLWLGRRTTGRNVLLVAAPAVALLLLSYTRTATLGLVVGIAVAGLSLVLTTVRARRFVVATGMVVGLVAVALAPLVQLWFRRGQDDEDFSNLTGRQKVWDALLSEPRTAYEQLFGSGLSNKTFGGLPIDSSWLAVFQEQGYVGIALVVAMLMTLLIAAVLRPPSAARACALFLITYCIVASYTEVGLGDASPYLLHLTVAAALLSPVTTPTPAQEAR